MLKFDGPEMAVTSQNSYSALQNVPVVNEKIQSELSMNRLAGPFNSPPPFDNFKCSSLALREKK